jgi:PilZ domain
MDLERRNNERSNSNIAAVIRGEDTAFSTSCVVRNLSEGGARLLVTDQQPLPTRFILCFKANSFVGRRCQTVWRLGNKVGVRFISAADSSIRAHNGPGVSAETSHLRFQREPQ